MRHGRRWLRDLSDTEMDVPALPLKWEVIIGSEFTAAEFQAATPKERVVMCLEMAGEAGQSASRANGEARDAFVALARQWSELADEIESAENEKYGGGKPEVEDESNR